MAYNLGITLDKLYAMSSTEYMGWIKYFNERPVGHREDHRAAILMQTTYQGKQKLKPEEFFPSLKIIREANSTKINKAKSFIDMMQAKSGNKRINTKK